MCIRDRLGIAVVSGRALMVLGVWQVRAVDKALDRLWTRGFAPFVYRLKYFFGQVAHALNGPELIVGRR